MKKTYLTVCIICMCAFFAVAQNGCNVRTPDSLRVDNYLSLHQGDSVIFHCFGGSTDSVGWYALYEDYCCGNRIAISNNGTFKIPLEQSDIYLCRIESLCDTTFVVSIDLDIYPNPTGIRFDDKPYTVLQTTDAIVVYPNINGVLRLYDFNGKLKTQRKLVTGARTTVHLNDLPRGIYILVFQNNKILSVKKILY